MAGHEALAEYMEVGAQNLFIHDGVSDPPEMYGSFAEPDPVRGTGRLAIVAAPVALTPAFFGGGRIASSCEERNPSDGGWW